MLGHKEMELLGQVQRKTTKLVRGLEKVRQQAEEVIIEYAQLEGSSIPIPGHAQHQPQGSLHMPESTVSTLLEFCQAWGSDHLSLFQGSTTLWVKKIFVISNLNLP